MVPLRYSPRTASGAIPEAPLVLIDLHSDADFVGRTYLMAFRKDMLKPLIGCVEALTGLIRGDPLAPF